MWKLIASLAAIALYGVGIFYDLRGDSDSAILVTTQAIFVLLLAHIPGTCSGANAKGPKGDQGPPGPIGPRGEDGTPTPCFGALWQLNGNRCRMCGALPVLNINGLCPSCGMEQQAYGNGGERD